MASRFSNDVLIERAETHNQCEDKIRKKYGANYEILMRKTVPIGGFLGFFEKEGVELSFIPKYPATSRPLETATPKVYDFETEQRKILEAHPPKQDPHLKIVLEELRSLKEHVVSPQSAIVSEEHPNLAKLRDLFLQNEFSAAYTTQMLDRAKKSFSLEELDNFDFIERIVVKWIGESIKIAPDFNLVGRPHIVTLVGPTGVGKTTTVAKFAAKCIVPSNFTNRRLRVRMLTIDNFRIAAKQQLENYANVMDIPFSAPETDEELKKLLTLYRDDVDLVLIDTIGCSPKDYSKIADMRKILDLKGAASDTYLALSASTKDSVLRNSIQQFEAFGCNSVIITKLDETDNVGNIISVLSEKNKSVAYITTGQNVPNDIEKASVVTFLIHLVGFKINRTEIEQYFGSKLAD